MTLKQDLMLLGACQEAVDWLGDRTEREMWDQCERPDWLLWLCGKKAGQPDWPTRKEVVLAACACARFALPHVPPDEPRPLRAIEAAELWARCGQEPHEITAARAAAAAAADAAYAAAVAAAYAAAVAAAYAAAAAAAAAATYADAAYAAAYSAASAAAAAYSAAYADAYADAADDAYDAAVDARVNASRALCKIVRNMLPPGNICVAQTKENRK